MAKKTVFQPTDKLSLETFNIEDSKTYGIWKNKYVNEIEEVIITESRLMIMFKTESLADAIALLSSTNLVNSVVKVKEIREIDISNVIDPNKYETLFEPEV